MDSFPNELKNQIFCFLVCLPFKNGCLKKPGIIFFSVKFEDNFFFLIFMKNKIKTP